MMCASDQRKNGVLRVVITVIRNSKMGVRVIKRNVYQCVMSEEVRLE